jgi:hypothetical protein
MNVETTAATTVRVRTGPLVAPVLGRVVGMLAARAQCPIDRLDDAMLLTDAVAAHAPAHVTDEVVQVVVAADESSLRLRVGPLGDGGHERLLADADLPGVGNVLERVADEVGPADDGDLLVVLRYGE